MQGVRGSSPRSSTNRDETADQSPLAGAAGGVPSPRTHVTEIDRDRADHRAERRATRIERYDPAAIEPRWQARWAELGLYETDLDDDVAAASSTC